MKLRCLFVLFLLLAAAGCDIKTGPMPPVDVYFSPKGGCEEAVVREIDKAQQTIFVQAYSFTSEPIAGALVNAQQRGVVVHAIIDKGALKQSTCAKVVASIAGRGVSVMVDGLHAIAHNKVMIIDGQVLLTGSFNFTKQAEHNNAENLLVIHDPGLAQRYLANWHLHEEHSKTYTGHEAESESRSGERSRKSKRQGMLDEPPDENEN